MASVKRGIGKRIASFPGVNDAVHEEANRRAYKVRAASSGHILSGEFQRSIKVIKANGPHRRQDWLIAVNHPWTISINWGHKDSKTGRPIRGIHAIEKGLE